MARHHPVVPTYKGGHGNKLYELDLMMPLFILQSLYTLLDMATHFEAIDSRESSNFCKVNSSNQVPDGDSIGRFRRLLEEHGLQEQLFAQVVELLTERGLILKKGTIVDTTFTTPAVRGFICAAFPYNYVSTRIE